MRRTLQLDLAWAGPRLVSVGDRGLIFTSDDQGLTWRQSGPAPLRVLLTAVCFSDERHGIAVGHDQVILTSGDAGQTWRLAHSSAENRQPLLDVWCGAQGRAIAVGAYGAYLDSRDRGVTWTPRKFEARPVKAAAPSDVSDLHLNRIVGASGSRLYIAAEAGHLYRSDDAGQTWVGLPSPYDGSFFGILPLDGESLLAYGLRGHLFRSDDAGRAWRRIDTGTVAMLNDAVRLPDGGVAIVGLSGVVLSSREPGGPYRLHQQDDRKGLSAALALRRTGALAVAGEAGAKRLVPGNLP